MRIVLFRHGDRETNNEANGVSNPPLNGRGKKQSEMLSQKVHVGQLPAPSKLWVSPRIRTQQTLAPLARQTGLEPQILTELDERTSSENMSQFRSRVDRFMQKISTLDGVIYMCSHMDWIEEALILIHSDTDLLQAKYQYWPPGQFMLFRVENGLWHLEEFGGLPC